MLPRIPVVALLILVLGLLSSTRAARILGVFGMKGKSHTMITEPLMRELALRGHEVLQFGHYPPSERNESLTNYRYVQFRKEGNFGPGLDLNMLENAYTRTVNPLKLLHSGLADCQAILSDPQVVQLIRSDLKFDLLIVEVFNADCYLGFAHRFQVPVVGISTCTLMPWVHARFGLPDNPAYVPNLYSGYPSEMRFHERLINAVQGAYLKIAQRVYFAPRDQLITERAFGSDLPSLQEIGKNISMLLLNTHHTVNEPRPQTTNSAEIGGIHIQKPKQLSEDLEKFVAGAKHGVVMFSMGSMIRASSMPVENAAALLRAFGTLKQRVIWKWEADPPAPLPKNVLMLKWLPQFDVLCHNNTRLFIGHGGLLSTSEAAYCGVPLLGVAMYGDQRTNLAAAAKAGTARSIPYSTLKEADVFLKHIDEMLKDPSYRENAKILSERFRDRPMSPLDTAVYWTEYVIRHKGAPHLRSAARNLSWWQEALLDVVAVVLLAAGALLVLLVAAVKLLLRFLFSVRGVCSKAMRTSKQKKA